MTVFVVLIGLSVAIEVAVTWKMWPPWRSSDVPTAWLLFALAVVLVVYDTAILLATLSVAIPPILAMLMLVLKAAAMGWWLWAIRKARQPVGKEPS